MKLESSKVTSYMPITLSITLETIEEFNALYTLCDSESDAVVDNSHASLSHGKNAEENGKIIDNVRAMQMALIAHLQYQY